MKRHPERAGKAVGRRSRHPAGGMPPRWSVISVHLKEITRLVVAGMGMRFQGDDGVNGYGCFLALRRRFLSR